MKKGEDCRIHVVCPFFEHVNVRQTQIVCEGFAIGFNAVNFKSYGGCSSHLRKYCQNLDNYCNCPHAKALLEKKYGGNNEK